MTAETTKENKSLIRVTRIKQIYFFVDEIATTEKTNNTTNINLEYKSWANAERNMFIFSLKTTYSFVDLKEPFIQSEIQNAFEIPDIEQYLDNSEEIKLPINILEQILEISISHARAILSINLAGTSYNEIFLPVFNSKIVAKSLFKNISDLGDEETEK